MKDGVSLLLPRTGTLKKADDPSTAYGRFFPPSPRDGNAKRYRKLFRMTDGVSLLLPRTGTLKMADDTRMIYTLSELGPSDSFAVARIDTGSFSEKDIIAKVTFDDRPSTVNSQKRQFNERVQRFVKIVRPATNTDITGGLLQAIEYLDEKATAHT